MKILIKIYAGSYFNATSLLDTVSKLMYNTSDLNNIKIIICLDNKNIFLDDTLVYEKLLCVGNLDIITVDSGPIVGINYGLELCDFDIILPIITPVTNTAKGYDENIVKIYQFYSPNLDGIVIFDNSTIPAIGKNWYDQFKCVYYNQYTEVHTAYEDLINLSRYINKFYRSNIKPIMTKSFVEESRTKDKEILAKRIENNFGLKQPLLSILTPTLAGRNMVRQILFSQINHQKRLLLNPNDVEFCNLSDDGQLTIGEKRNILTKNARGKYITCVDDDDFISEDYMKQLLQCIRDGEDLDCITFIMFNHIFGEYDRHQKHSNCIFNTTLPFSKLSDREDGRYRYFSHICCIRSEIAKKFIFPHVDKGEDNIWIKAVYDSNLVQKTKHINKALYIRNSDTYRSRKGT
jgi:hypothetical protein